ncbi:acyl carrier protein [Parablautia muri]|uniref:Acyl carrier protein n=1 Tax=Parablautia muri TaxID=2320879 RepID=A0A9X5BF63_9FIRM|nr:acyl carrier protein [Parablautia muri]NBJ92673.1 acyl carrier protein [Parablautia muri]
MCNLEKYDEIFVDVFSIEEKNLNENIVRGAVKDWDSLGHVKLITTIEDVFNIMFDTEDILEFDSYDKGKEILKKYNITV